MSLGGGCRRCQLSPTLAFLGSCCCLVFYLAQNESLEGKASRLQEQLSALSGQLERVKAEQSQRLQEKERLLERQETLQGQLEQQVSQGREKVRNCYYL